MLNCSALSCRGPILFWAGDNLVGETFFGGLHNFLSLYNLVRLTAGRSYRYGRARLCLLIVVADR